MLAMVAVDGVATMVGLSVATGAETSTGWGRRLAAPLGVVLLYGAELAHLPIMHRQPAGSPGTAVPRMHRPSRDPPEGASWKT